LRGGEDAHPAAYMNRRECEAKSEIQPSNARFCEVAVQQSEQNESFAPAVLALQR